MSMNRKKLRIGLSRDFLNLDGSRNFDDEAWERLVTSSNIEICFLDQPATMRITRADAEQFDVLLIKRNPVDASAVAGSGTPDSSNLRLCLLVRNGAGYDHIDVDACTQAGVMVSVTPGAVSHSVASSILAMMLAFSHRIFERDRLTRAGHWNQRWVEQGMALKGRTLGVVGLGNIGLEVFRLAAPWQMHHLGYAPHLHVQRYQGLNIELVDLATLLAQSDFIALCCPLTEQTRHLIDATAFGRMRQNAFLINTARGEIVDEASLIDALRENRIAGAGIDVYETEPPRKDHPLFFLSNVILGSHNFAYSDELNRAANRAVADAVIALATGAVPLNLLNPKVLDHPRLNGLSH